MVNFNGKIFEESENVVSFSNRAYKYGDGLFETMKAYGERILFLEDHYFRLMASMRMLRMEIPLKFTMDYFKDEIVKTIQSNGYQSWIRVRFSVNRAGAGLFLPKTREIDFLVECSVLDSVNNEDPYEIELFKDFHIASGMLSNIKTNNRILNVLGSIYANENGYQNCILINERKNVVEALNGNVFLAMGKVIKTPALEEGCINGITRKKVIEIIKSNLDLEIEETEISTFDLVKADELFITNAIRQIQAVTHYRKTLFKKDIGQYVANELGKLIEQQLQL